MQVESLGRYVIEKELGRGAMGRVFLAHDPQIDRRVAIKTIQIFSTLPESERVSARERFLREARSAGKLLHPGIVTIFDVGEAGGVPYLAMEFVEGTTLDAFCREDTLLPVPDVVELIAVAAEALAFAHSRGIVHRDIKPANLMRVGTRAVKIMDFGLAKSPTTSMTHDGALLGTPNYMSPEQVRGEALDGRADLFALGVVCYEMLTGVKPFGGDSISSVLYRIVHEPPKDSSLRLDRVPASLSAFLTRALAKSPEARFPDGAAFAAALRKAGEAAEVATLRPGEARIASPASKAERAKASARSRSAVGVRRSKTPWIVVGVIAIALIGASFVLLPPRFGAPAEPPVTARVRTEPPGIPVRLNGAPLMGDAVSFPRAGPFGVLTAAEACREAKHRLEVGDAGGEIVLVLDPTRADVPVDPGVPGAKVIVNGQVAGTTPVSVSLDLCRDNSIELSAAGFTATSVTVPARATPLSARNTAASLRLQAIPMGRLVLPAPRELVQFYVDGKPAEAGGSLDLPAGPHDVRAVDAKRFVDVAVTTEVAAGGTAKPQFSLPALSRLVVQTFPPNCRVTARRAGGEWRPLGETPLRYELASGRYALRIESPLSGETREQDVELKPGLNAPLRVSFGRSGR